MVTIFPDGIDNLITKIDQPVLVALVDDPKLLGHQVDLAQLQIDALTAPDPGISMDFIVIEVPRADRRDKLNQESVHRYRIPFNNLKPDHIWGKLADDEFLIKIGAAKKSREDGKIYPTLGGLIFFGDFITITEELPNYFLDYRERLSNETRWSDRVCSG